MTLCARPGAYGPRSRVVNRRPQLQLRSGPEQVGDAGRDRPLKSRLVTATKSISAFPHFADLSRTSREVREVPQADMKEADAPVGGVRAITLHALWATNRSGP